MPPTDAAAAGQPAAPPTAAAPPPAAAAPARIAIQWNDLNTRRVDQRLKEQAALERNRRQAAMDPLSATTSALAIEDAVDGRPAPAVGARPPGVIHHPAIALALFGLLGGLLAWAAGYGIDRLLPDPRQQAVQHMESVNKLRGRQANHSMSADAAGRAIASLRRAYAANPYFALYADETLTPQQRADRLATVDRQQWPRRFAANLLSYGLSGMLIAAMLATAEPWLAGRRQAAVVDALIGATAGLIGAAVVSLFVQQLFNALIDPNAPPLPASAHGLDPRRMAAYAVSWGVLGLFVTIGPGLVMRNGKKLAIGLLGGLVGGLIGGAAFAPIDALAGNELVSRGVALCLIGVVAGGLVGLIEHAARTGWLKVTAGLIAGKQFILYRNPTFIGSGPECPIYLFKDAAVGRRHAAVHAVPGGFELENLPLGGQTLVNGRPIAARARLRNGDDVQVGATHFRFQEKVKASP